MELSVENVCGLLIRSKLLSADEVKDVYQRWQNEGRGAPATADQFGRWLVARQHLTDYQASLLLRGLADNFFLGPYKILDRIGQGCMAGVFKAAHVLGQVVAIKVLPPSKAKDAQSLGRFQRETRLALRLKHPNVTRTFQVGEFNGLHYLVMEYLEGETLRDVLLRRGKLPPAEAVRLVHQALTGLQHFHEQGLIHRDLKPANLMLVPISRRGREGEAGPADTTTGATVKILDVGLARALCDDETVDFKENPTLTGEGVLLGTPDYLAPEQARDAHKADIRSDIYSLGCVLYHCLAGQTPFPDKSLINQMIRHLKETPRPLREFNPAVPDGLQQIINWMMAKDPAQRYPTPERAAQALQMFLAAGAETAGVSEAEPKMRSYLTWLEADNDGSGPSEAAAAPAAVEPAPASAGAEPSPPEAEAPRQAGARQRSRDQKARKPAPAPPASPPDSAPATPQERPDVELVVSPWSRTVITLPVKEVNLSRRDLLMLGIGAGSVLFAGLVGMGLARLKNRRARQTPPPAPEPADGGKEGG